MGLAYVFGKRALIVFVLIKELYAEIMGNDNMVAYNVAKREMDSMLSFVQEIITAAANGEDPDTVEESTGGCSGSCATCGGCS